MYVRPQYIMRRVRDGQPFSNRFSDRFSNSFSSRSHETSPCEMKNKFMNESMATGCEPKLLNSRKESRKTSLLAVNTA
jgi:hypothetical protein